MHQVRRKCNREERSPPRARLPTHSPSASPPRPTTSTPPTNSHQNVGNAVNVLKLFAYDPATPSPSSTLNKPLTSSPNRSVPRPIIINNQRRLLRKSLIARQLRHIHGPRPRLVVLKDVEIIRDIPVGGFLNRYAGVEEDGVAAGEGTFGVAGLWSECRRGRYC